MAALQSYLSLLFSSFGKTKHRHRHRKTRRGKKRSGTKKLYMRGG
jgi:hypothetical protein